MGEARTLLERARAGEKITLRDKIEAETSLEELDAMQVAINSRGEAIHLDDVHAFARRRAKLKKDAR